MTRTLPTVLLCLALAAIAVAPTGTAYGGCVGVCVDATHDSEGNFDIQTCTGNVNVQVGLENEATFCS